jgi:4-amino-4-deoxy-L-arabinose transferase-like glycosyltransferase
MKSFDSALQKVLTICACYYLAVYCIVGAMRMSFPGALEWLESGMYYQMLRVLAGQHLYVEPSLEYIPYLYPPLYFYVTAALARITGPAFLTLRLVSYLSSLGSMALIGYIVYRESKRPFAGLWAAGLFAATYSISATYFDLARVDSLFLFLFLGALTAVRFVPGIKGCLLAAVLLAGAALTKQTGLILSLPLLLYVFLFRSRPQALCFTGLFILLTSLLSLGLNTASEGWYFFYTFTLPSRHQILWDRMWSFWLQQILAPLGIIACMSVSTFFLNPFKKSRKIILLYAPTLMAMLAATCMHWMKIAAYKNVLIPAHAALAIGAGLALAAFPTNWIRRLFLVATCIQFALLYYNPLQIIPSADNADTVRSAVAAIKSIEGEVLAPANGYLPVMAGKKHSAHIACINDIFFAGPGPIRDRLAIEIRDAIRKKRFAAILLDRKFPFFQHEINTHYILAPQYSEQLTYWPLVKYWFIPSPPQP